MFSFAPKIAFGEQPVWVMNSGLKKGGVSRRLE